MCECFTYTHVHETHACLVSQKSEEDTGSSEIGVTMAMNHTVGAGHQVQDLCKSKYS